MAQRSLLDRPATVHLVRWALEVLLLMPVVLIPLPAMTADAAAVVLPAFLCLWVIMVSFALFFSLLAAMTRSPLAAACGIPVWMLVEKFLGSFLGYHCTVNTVLMGMMKADASMIWGSAGKTVAFAGLLFAALVLFYVIRYRKER